MCRIAGSVNHPQSVVGNAILHMRDGGPDFQDWQEIDTGLVFGHARLSILDLSDAGNQPMHTNRYSIVYNGEVYNYKDLGSGNNDTRVILEYIEKVGFVNALNAFNGMFALAVYDRVEKKIYMAVDRFGQKPLYYHHEGNQFVFASNPAAFYGIKDKWELDRDALQSYWLLGSIMGEDSLFKGIKKLTGSNYAVYDCLRHTLEVKRYYTPEPRKENIKDLIFDAIDKVKISDVPIHIFLSGGVDSTIIASRFEGGQSVHLESMEHTFAEQAARRFHVELKTVHISQIETEEYIRDYVFKSGEPSMAGIIPYTVSKETAKFGKVAITANGADELFFGYDRTSEFITPTQSHHLLRGSLAELTSAPNCLYGNRFDVPGNSLSQNTSNGRIFELKTYVQYDLNKTLDFASMCHGLEVRAPFLDHRLVECALSISESEHRAEWGNKTILKRILHELGFNRSFIKRRKVGFSLYEKPKNMPELIEKAWNFVKKEGFLCCNDADLTPRDKIYLENSAVSFLIWYDTWKHKIA